MPKVKTLQKHMKMLFTKQPFMKKTTVCLMNIGMTDIRQRKRPVQVYLTCTGFFILIVLFTRKSIYIIIIIINMCRLRIFEFSEIFSCQR